MDTFGTFEFRVRGYECGPDSLATFPSICNYLQEAAGLHADTLGFSMTDFAAKGENISWVLTRMRVKMLRYPRWKDTVTIDTFPHGGHRVTVYRDFIVKVGEEVVGYATSEWVVMDLAKRKIVAIPKFVYELGNDVRPPVIGENPFSKLRWDCQEASFELALQARRGDIDLNGHVNNVHYIEWLVEALPPEAGAVEDFEIVFKSETMAGEEVRASSVETEPGVWDAHVASPSGVNHVIGRLKCCAKN